jgi:hypothetical protein
VSSSSSAAIDSVHSDTGLSVVTKGAKRRVAVGHLVGTYAVETADDSHSISGKLGWAKTKGMTTFNLVVLRGLMFTVGRFFPDLIRKLPAEAADHRKETSAVRIHSPDFLARNGIGSHR